jgi:protein-S-isoprenylcysteine O-methyltransferase Ste14
MGMLGHMFTFDLRITEHHRLVTSGPYALVRHPSYTGIMVTMLGLLACMGERGSWLRACEGAIPTLARKAGWAYLAYCMLLTWMLVKRTPIEDEMMKQTFGKQWDEWRGSVRYRLMPGLY